MGRTPALIFFLIAAPASAGPSWVEVRSSHFRVVSDAGEGEARRVASELEKIRSVYQLVVGPEVEPGDPILVFASTRPTTVERRR